MILGKTNNAANVKSGERREERGELDDVGAEDVKSVNGADSDVNPKQAKDESKGAATDKASQDSKSGDSGSVVMATAVETAMAMATATELPRMLTSRKAQAQRTFLR